MKRAMAVFMSITMLCLSLCFTSCGYMNRKFSETRYDYFDTFSTLTVFCSSQKEFDTYSTVFNSTLEKYHRLLDSFNEYDEVCNIYTLNQTAGMGDVTVSEELFDFLECSKYIHEKTRGYTSITIGALSTVWKTSIEQEQLPDSKLLDEASKHTSISCLVLDRENMTASISDPLCRLDAGAAGKGYVCDILRQKLQEAGCKSFLINLGGTLNAYGTKTGQMPWTATVEYPDGSAVDVLLEIQDISVSTSGSYQRGFWANNKRYHHIVNPKTSYPENIHSSVSIICESAYIADCLSTALFCVDIQTGTEILQEFDNTDAIWIDSNHTITYTDGIAHYFDQERS